MKIDPVEEWKDEEQFISFKAFAHERGVDGLKKSVNKFFADFLDKHQKVSIIVVLVLSIV